MMRNRVRLANASLASVLLFLCVPAHTCAQPVNIRISSALQYKVDAAGWRVRLPRGTTFKLTPSLTSGSFDDDDVVVRTDRAPGGSELTVTFPQGTVVQTVANSANRVTIPLRTFVTLQAGSSVKVPHDNPNTTVTLDRAVTATTVDLLQITLPAPAPVPATVPPPRRASILVCNPDPGLTVRACVGNAVWAPAVSVVSPSIPVRCAGGHQLYMPTYLYLLPAY
jgi:hypothetical protein